MDHASFYHGQFHPSFLNIQKKKKNSTAFAVIIHYNIQTIVLHFFFRENARMQQTMSDEEINRYFMMADAHTNSSLDGKRKISRLFVSNQFLREIPTQHLQKIIYNRKKSSSGFAIVYIRSLLPYIAHLWVKTWAVFWLLWYHINQKIIPPADTKRIVMYLDTTNKVLEQKKKSLLH